MSREEKKKEQAKKRAEVILKVRTGLMTAKEAAKELGVSRKTYYEWEERGLQGMMEALLNRPPGRPEKKKDPEKNQLKKQVEDLEQQLYLSDHVQEIRKLMEGLPSLKDLDPDHPSLGEKKKMTHNLQVTLVKLIEVIKTMINVPFRKVCESLELAYSTFMRWKSRAARGEAPVKKPGPQKEDPLEVEGLMDRIGDLEHRKKRSLNVGSLFEEYKDLVSRRSFQELVRLAREDARREERALMRHIEWKQPGLVYSMDDTYFGRDEVNKKLYLHTVRDLSSRYQFDPIAGDFASGIQVAKNLEYLFNRYGPPLFLKRDGGSNLKHQAVEDVLSRYMVIPLESPRHYPPYNGAVEKAQSELKQKIWRRQKQYVSIPRRHFHVYAESAAHELNHLPRRCLKGKVSCQVFFLEKGGVKFSKRRRREIFEWIKKLSSAILVEIGKPGKRAAQSAWRMAVESWLHINGYIEVSMDGNVLPIFSPELSH